MRTLGLLVGGLLLGFVLVAVPRVASLGDAPTVQPRELNRSEIVFLTIGSGGCDICRSPELPGLLEQGLAASSSFAEANAMSIVRLGVAIDQDLDSGLELLARWGDYDVLSVGGGWLNDLASKYLWGELAGPASVPQVIISRRFVSGPPDDVYGLAGEVVLARFVGLEDLRTMADEIRGGRLEAGMRLLFPVDQGGGVGGTR